MKKIIFNTIILLFATGICGNLPVYATDEAQISVMQARLSTHPTISTVTYKDTSRIQIHADTMIIKRIETLNTLLRRITNDTHFAGTDKVHLTSDIQMTITNLQTLKTKIDADTDPVTALADAQTIVTAYHIYVIYEPKIRLFIIVDNLQDIANRLNQLMPELTNIGRNSSTSAQTALLDISTKLQNINTKLATDTATLNSIAASEDIPTAQQSLTKVKTDLVTVRKDFEVIRSDLATFAAHIISSATPPVTP